MEDFDKYLDRLVENFYDTGKVVLNETTDSINWDKIGKVIRDPNKSEQIYELLIDMFPNAKEVIDYNYYGDNEEPSPNDTFAEMKSFLWNIDKNTIKGPDLRLSTGFEIDGEYKKDLEKKYDDYVGGKIDKYFRDSSNDPRDTTKEGFKNLPPILVMGKKVIDGNHRTFLAQKVGAELPTFEMVEEPNTHPNAQKILSIIHPNDSDEDGIPNRLDISQEPNLNEHDSILDRIVEEFFDTGKVVLNEQEITPEIIKKSLDDNNFHLKNVSTELKEKYNTPSLPHYKAINAYFKRMIKGSEEPEKTDWVNLQNYFNNTYDDIVNNRKGGEKNKNDTLEVVELRSTNTEEELSNYGIDEIVGLKRGTTTRWISAIKKDYKNLKSFNGIGGDDFIDMQTKLKNRKKFSDEYKENFRNQFFKIIELYTNPKFRGTYYSGDDNELFYDKMSKEVGLTAGYIESMLTHLKQGRPPHSGWFSELEMSEMREKAIKSASIRVDGDNAHRVRNIEKIFDTWVTNFFNYQKTMDDLKGGDETRPFNSVADLRNYIGKYIKDYENGKRFSKWKNAIKKLKIKTILLDDGSGAINRSEVQKIIKDPLWTGAKTEDYVINKILKDSFGWVVVNDTTWDSLKYEQSFTEKGFQRPKGKVKGKESRIHSLEDGYLTKSIIAGVKSEEIIENIIENITKYIGKEKIIKYDLIVGKNFYAENGEVPIMRANQKIEVKKINSSDSYFAEVLASPMKQTDSLIKNDDNWKERYNEVIKGVYYWLNNEGRNTGLTMLKKFADDLSGFFISDEVFIPISEVEFYLSNKGQNSCDDHWRITIRYRIKEGATTYKLENGVLINNELKINFSEGYKVCGDETPKVIYSKTTDRIDNIIENFFDTGNFDI